MLAVALAWGIGLSQLALEGVLVAASVHLCRLAWWALRHPLRPGAQAEGELPAVTVQLPIRNERYVAERVLRAACALSWPHGRLEVQALDDSDDDTSAIIDRVAAELRAAGHDVKVLRRADRAGHKAGNLAHGLASARGELVCVLDADNVPAPDLLLRLAGALLRDPRAGFAQARWSFDNEGASLVTRVQALILDGLMVVEQARLAALARPLSFNGTAGLWRKEALVAAGGWLPPGGGAALTEDLDLSYRAALVGWHGVQVPAVAVTTELPERMAAFRAQQERWVRGAGQVLRSLGGRAPVSMLAHLARHARQPLVVAMSLGLPALALGWVARPDWLVPAWPYVLALVLAAVSGYYAAARARIGRPVWSALALAPALLALAIGLSLTLSVALARGVLGGRAAPWARTPKSGGLPNAAYRAPRPLLAVLELAIGLALAAAAAVVGARHAWDAAAGLAFVASGWLWVGGGSLRS